MACTPYPMSMAAWCTEKHCAVSTTMDVSVRIVALHASTLSARPLEPGEDSPHHVRVENAADQRRPWNALCSQAMTPRRFQQLIPACPY